MKTQKTSFAPYIGITDFMSREQSLAMLSSFQTMASGGIPHKLMIGVMMSYKTLNKMETKWTKAFPRNEDVSHIFVDHPLALNTLHYADYTNTDVLDCLTQAVFYGGFDIHALQLDMVWPKPSDIAGAMYRDNISVILQVGKNALAEAHDDPQEVLARLEEYTGVIHGVLFDKSMGQGKVMDVDILSPYVEAVYEHLPHLRVAVAGGLGPTTVGIAMPLISRFPDISIDAQGRLRPSGNALDPIDWELANTYLKEATKLFEK